MRTLLEIVQEALSRGESFLRKSTLSSPACAWCDGAILDKIGDRDHTLHHQNEFSGKPVNGEEIVPSRIRRMENTNCTAAKGDSKLEGWINFQDD
jgi:hypothetical protein